MNNRTRTGLLALGFDTDLIARIEGHGHTIAALRNLSRNALASQYDETEVGIILDRIVRKPINEEVVEKVIHDADGACCFCADGNQSRPYQIHHAVEYSKTQDNSPENLILICPNHHQTVPKTMTADQQKGVRSAWHAIVTMAKSYRKKGLSFPYGSFISLDFQSPPKPQELIEGYRLSPSTALDVSRHPLAAESVIKLKDKKSLVVGGGSGSGKTTLAIGIAGHLWEQDFLVFIYRPSKAATVSHVAAVLTFLGASDRPSILVLDDANQYFSEADLSEIMAAGTPNAYPVATWAYDRRSNTERFERHFPDWLYVNWEELRSFTHTYLLAHDAEITAAIRQRQDPSDLGRIGSSAMDIPLKHFIRRYESTARSAAEFFFLLRGGTDAVVQEISILVGDGRADVPVVYAAIEQIAGFEKTVNVSEVVEACTSAPVQGTPMATSTW